MLLFLYHYLLPHLPSPITGGWTAHLPSSLLILAPGYFSPVTPNLLKSLLVLSADSLTELVIFRLSVASSAKLPRPAPGWFMCLLHAILIPHMHFYRCAWPDVLKSKDFTLPRPSVVNS